MNLPLREIDVFGVYLAPGGVVLVITTVIFLTVRWALNHVVDANRFVWRRPLFDVACFVIFYCLAVLTMRPG